MVLNVDMELVSIVCAKCEKSFDKSLKLFNQSVKKGWKHFCSRRCALDNRNQTVERPCGTCGSPVVRQHHIVESSKSGYVFCNKSCAVKYNNRILRSGENNPNFRKAGLFGGNRKAKNNSHYRTICFQYHEKKCVVCGEDKVVAVHHFDHNHDNHDPTNLIPMCPTHHGYMHSKHRHLIEATVNAYHERLFEALPLLERHSEADEYDDSDVCEEELWQVAEEQVY